MLDLGKEKNLPHKRKAAEQKEAKQNVADLQELAAALMEQNALLVEQNTALTTQLADMQEILEAQNA